MSETEGLLSQLESFRTEEWAARAAAALRDPAMKFVGQPGARAETTAASLLRIYRLRLEHVRRVGLPTWGMEYLVSVLEKMSPSDLIAGRPFHSPSHAVFPFFDSSGRLIACVTVEGGAAPKPGSMGDEEAD